MGKFSIPNETGLVRQLNINDTFGELWSSFNLDLHSNFGKMRLAHPLKRTANGADLDDNQVEAFAFDGDNAYALTEGVLYSTDAFSDFETWAIQNDTDLVSGSIDMTVFKGQLVIAAGPDIDAFNLESGVNYGDYTSGWWTDRGNPSLHTLGVSDNVPRVIEVARIGTETLVVTDGSDVHAYVGGIGSAPITNVTVDIGDSYTASCFKSGIRKGWIGSYTTLEDEAMVFEWDCASTNYTQSFPLGAKAALAMCLDDDDAPIVITERGEIKKFNNAGFVTIAQLPIAYKPVFADNWDNPNNTLRPVHPKGMKRVGRYVLIMVNFVDTDNLPLDERTPAGIWCLNLDTKSLTHLSSPNNEYGFIRTGPLMTLDNENGRLYTAAVLNQDTDECGIWMEDLAAASENRGYLTTTEIETSEIKDIYNEIAAKAQMFDDQSVLVKFRNKKDIDTPVVAQNSVWADSTTFNTTDDLSIIKARFDASAENRDEIEVIGGYGAGSLAHITNIEFSSATYSVTIDEEIGSAGQECKVRIDDWKKVPKTMIRENGDTERFGTGDVGAFGQFRIELRGFDNFPEIRSLLASTKNKEKN